MITGWRFIGLRSSLSTLINSKISRLVFDLILNHWLDFRPIGLMSKVLQSIRRYHPLRNVLKKVTYPKTYHLSNPKKQSSSFSVHSVYSVVKKKSFPVYSVISLLSYIFEIISDIRMNSLREHNQKSDSNYDYLCIR